MLYYVGQRSLIFNARTFIYWFTIGILHALIVFLIPYFVYANSVMNKNAYNNDIWSFSVTSFTAVIFIVNLKLMVQERYFTWINLFSVFVLSFGVYFTYIWATNYTSFS